MNSFSINPSPVLTKYLVGEIAAFRADPLVIVDLGARGGAHAEWAVFGNDIRLLCFEADEVEYRRLVQTAPSTVTYIPWAIGKESGRRTLYETKLPAGTGLYPANKDYFGRLLNRDNQEVVAEHSVEVHTLDEALMAHGNPSVDFIKLDVEGAELDVLEGSPLCVNSSSLIGILSEIRFHADINGSPPFSALDAFLAQRGFRLYDLQFHHQSRMVLPYPALGNYRLPNGERFHAYTTHGQIQDGDALYFKDLLLPEGRQVAATKSATQLLKLCALLEIYSLNDCAAELVLAFRSTLEPQFDTTRLLDLLASGIADRPIGYRRYCEDYFADRTQPIHRRIARWGWRAVAWGLRRALAMANRRLERR